VLFELALTTSSALCFVFITWSKYWLIHQKKDAAPRGKSDQEKSYASKGGLPPEMLHERCAGLAEAARQVCKEERAQQLLLEFGSKTTH